MIWLHQRCLFISHILVTTCRGKADCKGEKAHCMRVSDSSLSVCVESEDASQIYRDAGKYLSVKKMAC